jgi:hypothetical protein
MQAEPGLNRLRIGYRKEAGRGGNSWRELPQDRLRVGVSLIYTKRHKQTWISSTAPCKDRFIKNESCHN